MEPGARRPPEFNEDSEAYALFRRGVEFLDGGHPAQAVMYLSRALRLEPGRNSIRETLGRAEYAVGRHARAAELFRAVLDDTPDNDYAHYALARCLRRLGHGEEARGHLRLARALHPHNSTYRAPVEGLD